MKTPAPRRRVGFSLIELLVVIGIVALLAAISVGTYFRVRAASDVARTNETLSKLNAPLFRMWSATLDQAGQDHREKRIPPVILAIADGDPDRARSLWTYVRAKNEFPQTFDEAWRDIYTPDIPTPLPAIQATKVLEHRKTFDSVATKLYGPGDLRGIGLYDSTDGTLAQRDYAMEAAALLYIALTQKGNRGETMGDEAVGALVGNIDVPFSDTTAANGVVVVNNNGTSTPPGLPAQLQTMSIRVFMDVYGKPLTFIRFASNGEIDDPNGGFAKRNVVSRDPFDPAGKLKSATWTTTRRQGAARLIFGSGRDTFGGTPPAQPSVDNWLPCIVSSGPDKYFGTIKPQTPPAGPPIRQDYMHWYLSPNLNMGNDSYFTLPAGSDDLLGYQQRREGQK